MGGQSPATTEPHSIPFSTEAGGLHCLNAHRELLAHSTAREFIQGELSMVHFAKRISGLIGLVALLGACGGGGGSSATPTNPPVVNAASGGMWQGTDPISGVSLEGAITEAGQLRFIGSDGGQYVGSVTTSGNSISGSFSGYAPTGLMYQDGSNHGTGTLSGTITARQTISATINYTTANNSQSSGSATFAFNAMYNSGSSLQTIDGNYTDLTSNATVNVNNGVIFAQDAVSGCVINGSVSIINASYDVYSVSYSFTGCAGTSAHLNNTTATGLAILDTSVSPNNAIIGVSNGAAGYILTQTLPKQ
jgi:hypothetical protein